MLRINDMFQPADLTCVDAYDGELTYDDFQYFDKDGFELNRAEEKLYRANELSVDTGYLHKVAYMANWIDLEEAEEPRFFMDHSFTCFRANYRGEAQKQIEEIAKWHPPARWLLQIRPKWGFDMDLNAVSNSGEIFELLHFEYDSYYYTDFVTQKKRVEDKLISIDWNAAADEVWDRRSEWEMWPGFKQNDWKTNLLMGWELSESTEKAIFVAT